jgi:hypothetical protein
LLQGTEDGAPRTNELAKYAERDMAMVNAWFNFLPLDPLNPPFSVSVRVDSGNTPHAQTTIESGSVFIAMGCFPPRLRTLTRSAHLKILQTYRMEIV